MLARLIPARVSEFLRRHRRSPWVPRAVAVLICVAVFAIVVGVRGLGGLEFLELKTYDVLLATQPKDTSVGKDIVVIGMNEADISAMGFPMPDAKMADLLGKILAGNPRAVGVDIFRDRPVHDTGANAHSGTFSGFLSQLRVWIAARRSRADLIKRLDDPRVVTVIKFEKSGTYIGAPPESEIQISQYGYADLPTDRDGRVRRVTLFFSNASGQFRAMGLRLAQRYLSAVGKETNQEFRLKALPEKGPGWFSLGRWQFHELRSDYGAYAQAETLNNQILLDFRGPRRYPIIPVGDVLSGKVPPQEFAGKVIVIGMAAPDSVKDFVSTSAVTDQFGPEVHAVIAEQLIRSAMTGRGPTPAKPDWAENIWIAGWVMLGGIAGYVVRQPAKIVVVMIVGVALLLSVVWAAFAAGICWLPALPALIGGVAAQGFVAQYLAHHERGERTMLNELFKRIVDEEVAETLWARRDEVLDEGGLAAKELRGTLLFTDLEGFTTITEAMDKSALMAFLNEYMSVMSDVVGHKPNAFVNKYIGDAVMAVYGPPLERSAEEAKSDARNAVESALEMRERLIEHHARWERQCAEGIKLKLANETPGAVPPWAAGVKSPEVRLRMRIGVQSGMVTAGSLGSAQRLEYTVIGDTVNTAARLEAYDKDMMPPDVAAGGCRILIGQDTLDLLPVGEYLTREVGSIRLKGKEQMVTIHGVIGRASPAATVSSARAPASNDADAGAKVSTAAAAAG